jgi:hypothetical protein
MFTMPFVSKSLAEHLFRGAVGITAILYAFKIGNVHPLASLLLGGIALLSFRGCPMCWITGLIGTIRQGWKH